MSAGFDLICCVVNMGDASKVLKAARKYGVKDGFISTGRGTAHNRILDFLKINETRKEIISMVVKTELTSETIKGINDDMSLEKPHHGIAFSYTISEFISSKNESDKDNIVNEEKQSMYKAIYVVVDKGRAEEVIEAANRAGARGGTVVNARASGIHEVQKLFSIEIEPEKEEVFIVAKNDLKDGIVESIRKDLKIDELGNGIIFVMDINEAYGLH